MKIHTLVCFCFVLFYGQCEWFYYNCHFPKVDYLQESNMLLTVAPGGLLWAELCPMPVHGLKSSPLGSQNVTVFRGRWHSNPDPVWQVSLYNKVRTQKTHWHTTVSRCSKETTTYKQGERPQEKRNLQILWSWTWTSSLQNRENIAQAMPSAVLCFDHPCWLTPRPVIYLRLRLGVGSSRQVRPHSVTTGTPLGLA